MKDDAHWMREALTLARTAFDENEVPVGAIVVRRGKVLGRGNNRSTESGVPFEHAEMIAMREAIDRIDSGILDECTLYATVEPCAMCAGAAVLAKVPRIVFGVHEPKTGACESVFSIPNEPALEHRMVVTGGIEADAARDLMQRFFQKQRKSGQK